MLPQAHFVDLLDEGLYQQYQHPLLRPAGYAGHAVRHAPAPALPGLAPSKAFILLMSPTSCRLSGVMKANVVSVDPEIMGGAPVFRGTRVPAQTLIDYLEGGESIDDFLEGFPTVTRDQVIGLLEDAKARILVPA
jgi:uncharacterized protein (DUF433 family)